MCAAEAVLLPATHGCARVPCVPSSLAAAGESGVVLLVAALFLGGPACRPRACSLTRAVWDRSVGECLLLFREMCLALLSILLLLWVPGVPRFLGDPILVLEESA